MDDESSDYDNFENELEIPNNISNNRIIINMKRGETSGQGSTIQNDNYPLSVFPAAFYISPENNDKQKGKLEIKMQAQI